MKACLGSWIPGPEEVCRALHTIPCHCAEMLLYLVSIKSVLGTAPLQAGQHWMCSAKKKNVAVNSRRSVWFCHLTDLAEHSLGRQGEDSAPHPWGWRSCASVGRKDALRLIQEHWREGRSSQEAADQDGPGAAERHRARANLDPLDSPLGGFCVSTDGCVWMLENLRVEGQRPRLLTQQLFPLLHHQTRPLEAPLQPWNDPTLSGLWCVRAQVGLHLGCPFRPPPGRQALDME